MPGSKYSYGRVLVGDDGISMRSKLLIVSDFRMAWDEMASWKVAESFMAPMENGNAEAISQMLELRSASEVHRVDRKATDDKLDALVAYLRLKCPEKEETVAPGESTG